MKHALQPLKFALVLAIGIAVGIWFAPYKTNGGNKISQVVDLIKRNYVDTVNIAVLEKKAINELLHSLDPHSNYFNATEAKQVNEPLEGSFQGIGIEFLLMRDTIFIANVVEDGPGNKAGLYPGDKIVKVDGTALGGKKLTNEKVIKLLKGKEGTIVELGIYRASQNKELIIAVERGSVAIKSVEAFYMADKKTGYIKISRFAATTMDEYESAFKSLRQSGLENLIIDVRDNGGGYLNTAQKLADEFLSNGQKILTTKGEHSRNESYAATSEGEFENGRLIILVNENSASASEILGGALQDNDRAVILGRRTFGKGLVQNTFNLKDGSAVRLTISRYYTPSGRSIQKPYYQGYTTYEEDNRSRYQNGELFVEDSIKSNHSMVFKTLSGRAVYGGGGIVPDVFVPLDTARKSGLYANLTEKGLIRETAYLFVERNSKLKESFENVAIFNSGYKVEASLWQMLRNLANTAKVDWLESDFEKSKPEIEKSVKAFIAKQLFKNNGYFYVENASDSTFIKALNQINSSDFEEKLKPH